MQAVRHARSMLSQRAVGAAPVPLVRRDAVEKRVAAVRARAIVFARALQKPPFHHETVHRLRTHLRRLQAYAEFLQRPRIAARLAECVSWLSDLRALYVFQQALRRRGDRKSTRLNSSHGYISYAVFCLKKKNRKDN